jgi:hypothetical protein
VCIEYIYIYIYIYVLHPAYIYVYLFIYVLAGSTDSNSKNKISCCTIRTLCASRHSIPISTVWSKELDMKLSKAGQVLRVSVE